MSDEGQDKKICGIVMPISSIDGCNEAHWADVLEIMSEAIIDAGFEPNLVSNADEVGVIHKRIIQNLHDNPIVVCDVSGKNPNVMFELGMRLAFDKPTIIIKDNQTSFMFDTSSIEHLEYPRDLRFSKINEFKSKLSSKLLATYTRATTDESYTTFLKHFGEFKIAKIDKTEVSGQEFILDELRSMRQAIMRLDRGEPVPKRRSADVDVCLNNVNSEGTQEVLAYAMGIDNVRGARIDRSGPHPHIQLMLADKSSGAVADVQGAIKRYAKLLRAPRVEKEEEINS